MKALILLIISGILAAGVFIAGKQAANEQLSPLLILFWQMGGGAAVVWLVCWVLRIFPVWNWLHFRYYLLGGLLGVSIPYLLAFTVLQNLQVGIVGLLTALSPLVTYAFARLLRIEPGNPLRLLGLVIGLCGVILLINPEGALQASDNSWYLLLAMGIPVSLAASNIYRSRFWPAGSAAMPLVNGMLTVQSLGLLVINLVLGNFGDLSLQFDSMGYVLLALGLMAGVSYLTSFKLLRVGGPVYLSQMGYVITVVTLLAGITIWNEVYDQRDLISIGLILSGVLLTTLTNRFNHNLQPQPATGGR